MSTLSDLKSAARGPWNMAAAVTPHDTNDLANTTSALMIGTAGDLKVDMAGGPTITIPSAVVTAHPLLFIQVTRVYSTGTAASDIIALW